MKASFPLHKALVLFTFLCSIYTVNGQVVADKFGQNKIQIEQKKWFRYLAPNFAISYAKDDESLARFALSVVEEDYLELGKLFEHQLKKRIELLIYSDYSDYAQSNLGIEDHVINNGGVTDIKTQKIQVYFDGNHNNFRKQLRQGLATVLLGKIIAGTNLQEIVQNSVLMNLPSWFVLGAVGYATEDWNTTLDDELRDVLLQGKYNNFMEFARKRPRLAGHSLFYFIGQEYGKPTVSNLLYLTRINRSVDNGFLYVFGKTFYQVAGSEWFDYYRNRYNSDNDQRRFPNKGKVPIQINKKSLVKNVKISPDSKHLVFTEHNQGVQKVILTNIETNEQKVLYKFGEKDQTGDFDKLYPLVDWAGSNQLIVIFEKRDKVKIQYYNITTNKKEAAKTIKDLERVSSFAVNGRTDIVLVGILNGQSDLYRYNKGKLSAITDDFWDEGEVTFATIKGQKGLLFSSNRPRPLLDAFRIPYELPMANHDLFFYDLSTKSKALIQLTRTPLCSERSPIGLADNKFAYLSDQNGFFNRYIAEVDTILLRYERFLIMQDGSTRIVHPDTFIKHLPVDSSYLQPIFMETGVAYLNTNYSRNILEQHKNSSKIVDLFYKNGSYQIFVRDAKMERKMEDVLSTSYRFLLEKKSGLFSAKSQNKKLSTTSPTETSSTLTLPKELQLELDTLPPVRKDTGKIDLDNYEFQNEFDTKEEPSVKEENNPEYITPIELVEDDGDLKATERKKRPKGVSLTDKTSTKVVEWERKYTRPYKSLFKLNKITIQFDNTPLYNATDLYLGNYYQFQPLGVLAKIQFEDIYENFAIQLGIRMPVTFNGMEYFIDIENRKGLVDQRYSFYRRSRTENYIVTDTVNNTSIEARGRNIKHLIETEFKYPLSKTQSIRGILGVQLEKVAILAEDVPSLQVPIFNQNNLRMRLEYVYDNTIPLRHNARKGARFKAYFDLYKPFQVSTDPKLEINMDGGVTTAIGFDGRYYHTFDKKTIFAFRLAGATSFGQKKILYSLGGIENWIFTSTEDAIPLPSADNFGLQTLAATMRGFGNNARNGSSYMIGNFEIRIPIINYLSRNPPRNAMLRSLQLTGFIDVGTAWQGLTPFSDDNPLNTSIIDNSGPGQVSPVKVTVNYYRRPILFSYGIGIRTVLLGHYFKLDYAWGVETGQVQTPMLYLSLGTDF